MTPTGFRDLILSLSPVPGRVTRRRARELGISLPSLFNRSSIDNDHHPSPLTPLVEEDEPLALPVSTDLSFSSDSSSDDYPPPPLSIPSIMTKASVVQAAPTKPPVLTAGDLTPETVQDLEDALDRFYHMKDVADARHISYAMYAFQDRQISDWITTNRVTLKELSVVDFFTKLRD
ncbi:hypothetical protein CONPUDRAFT_160389, partial [Coniophora puteana RWD-64-598 SS2]